MRIAVAILVVLLLVAGAAGLYLVVTTPKTAAQISFPISPAQRALLARVPADADSFGLVPSAAGFYDRLLENPVLHDAVERWTSSSVMPQPWQLGAADVVVWRIGKTTSYAVTLDPFRAFLAHFWTSSNGEADTRWDGRTLIINGGDEAPMDAASLDALLQLASALPKGNVFAVQRDRSRGAYPPIGRPAVTSLSVTPKEITMVSRAAQREPLAAASNPIHARFPRGAMITIAFAHPPDALRDLRRLVGADIEELAGNGGALVVYDVDTGTLLPRPDGAIVLPKNEAARAALSQLGDVTRALGDTGETADSFLIAFDRTSIPRYRAESFVPAAWPATRWSLMADPGRLVPVLERLSDNAALRFAAPRIYRSAQDTRRWIDALTGAATIEAAESDVPDAEELRVRITSK